MKGVAALLGGMAIDTILVAVGPGDADRAKNFADAVVDVAAPTGADVVLLHVFTDEEYADVLDKLDFEDAGPDQAGDVARRRHAVRDLAGVLEDRDVHVDIRGAVGPHADSIVETAEAVGADMVYVGGRKRSPTGKAVFGDATQRVILDFDGAVTVITA